MAAMQVRGQLDLNSRLRVPTLDHTQTLLFPTSVTYVSPSEPNATSVGPSKHPGPVPSQPKALRKLPSGDFTFIIV